MKLNKRMMLGLVSMWGVGGGVAVLGSAGGLPPGRAVPPAGTSLHVGYRFEANSGQFDERIRYLSRGRGYGLFLTRSGATLTLRRPKAEAVLRMRLAGGRDVEPVGTGELAGKSNYFVGDRSRWRTGVPSYGRVRYPQVLPGVDVDYYGSDERQTEYDLLLAPGTNPDKLALVFEGADEIEIEASGAAVLRLSGGGEVRKSVPVAYQTDDQGQRTLVAARYEKRGRDRIGFVLGKYDRGQPLVIDPVFAYSTLLGGYGWDRAQGITVDGAGNTYVTGYTTSTDFPTAAPLQPVNGSPEGAAFVTKLPPSGGPTPVYSTYLGGTAAALGDRAISIAVDAAGNVYLAGETSAADFPRQAPIQGALNGIQDGFVTKIHSSGASLVYSTYLGGEGSDSADGIAVDSSGNAYVVGQTLSANFPVKSPAYRGTKPSSVAANSVFVTKFNPSGSMHVYSTYLGGNVEETAAGIAVDAAGNAYVTGSTASSNFPTKTPLQAALSGSIDVFVSKLNPAGSDLVYSTYLGGTLADFASDIALDGSGSAYLTGYTTSANFRIKTPAFKASNTASSTVTGFVSKLNAAGSDLTYSTYLGGNTEDVGLSIATDSAGNAYVAGYTTSPNFPAVASMQPHAGGQDAFVSKLNPAGSALLFSSHLGGAGEDQAAGIAADAAGNIYLSGQTSSWNFPTPEVTLQPFLAGDSDGFVTKLAPSGSFPPIKAKTKQDAVLMAASSSTSQACGGVAFTNARTLTVTDLNADGLVCPGCGAGNTYAPSDALDFIRLAFHGLHHDAPKTRNCNSDVRRTLLNNYASIFQGACAAGTCAGKPVHHLWRLSETSEAATTFNSLLGTTTAQFCNVHTATVITTQGTDFLDNDPIRVTCTGNGKAGEQVCGNAIEGKLRSLGMLLTVFIPDINDTVEPFPVNYCTVGAIQALPATKTAFTGLCPAGNPSFGGRCFSSVYRTTNPDGSVETDANCIQFVSTAACPTLSPSGVDCRGANLWLRYPDGTLVKDTTYLPGLVAPNFGRFILGSFFKIHATAAMPNNTGVCGLASTSEEQIGCLVGSADPCSLGFVGRRALGLPTPPNVTGLAVGGVVPNNPGVHYGTYPLAF